MPMAVGVYKIATILYCGYHFVMCTVEVRNSHPSQQAHIMTHVNNAS